MFAQLHCRSWFSFLAGASSPEALAEAAAARGVGALALTDVNGVYGVVRFQRACRAHGIRPVFGAEVTVEEHRLVLLATGEEGFSNLNRLLTEAHQRSREAPAATFTELMDHAEGLHCLTATREGRLWRLVDERRTDAAMRWLHQLHAVFGPRLSIELAHHAHPGDRLRIDRLLRLAERCYVPVIVTGDIRYAQAVDYRRYDLMTCIRLGITVFDDHADRPRNAEAHVRTEEELRRLVPCPAAFDRAAQVAEECTLDLIPGYITPPAASVPPPYSPRTYLHRRCWEGFARRYGAVAPSARRGTRAPDPAGAVVVVRPDAPRSRDELRRRAQEQLKKELAVIAQLDLDEFFLVVHEIVEEARRRGIRCAGRGSAANSIVAYLLGITGVDPIENRLLFERFLHAGRRGTPDIDVDFDSERREEIIAWMEERFGIEQTAMTATLITYRSRSALRDTAKALGWPPEVVNRMSKATPPHWSPNKDLSEYRVRLERIVGPSPLLGVLLERATDLQGAPRHLGLHSGGMILSRKPLWHFSPVQVSANGVNVVQFDKDDVEALGLVKFDVLGLRMLACLSEAVEIGERHACGLPDVDELPLDDPATYNLMRSSKTLGVFQIESQGQLHLLAQHQPEDFVDIINEIALFRPGPLQSGMVHPFVQRRRGLKPVEYPHPSLEPVLRDTYGVIVFQEQVLEVAHHFAHMSLEEADEFRRLMSKFRDPGEMEGMRARFVSGAVAHGIDHATATAVFENVAKFVGYGFCRSHAAAFAKTVYQSAYLKTHHPAPFLAAFLQHRPGMYNLMTLEEECRRFGVPVLLPDVNRSGVRYDLERVGGAGAAGRRGIATRLAIRKPLTAIQGMSEEHAKAIAWERLNGPFRTVQDFWERVALDVDLFENVARSGALDALAGDSRRALWEVGLLARRVRPGSKPSILFEIPAFTADDVPDLPKLTEEDRLAWDYQTHGAARVHPMTLVRRTLNDYEIRPISTCWGLGRAVSGGRGTGPHVGRGAFAGVPDPPSRDGPVVTIAGIAMMRQRPGTANGVLFLTLEDETGFIQCFVYPKVLEALDHVLSQASLIVRGKLQVMGNWRGLVLHHAWPLNGILGGYEGHPSMAGGRDRMVKAVEGGVNDTAAPAGTVAERSLPTGQAG